MDLATAKHSMKAMLGVLPGCERQKFMQWIQSNSLQQILDTPGAFVDEQDGESHVDSSNNEQPLLVLEAIRQELQDVLPPDCIFDSEAITIPECSVMCGSDATKVQHVDAFVYDEDDLDIACAQGKFSRSYCAKCGSKDIKDFDFISHSFSVNQVKFISRHLLANHHGETLLDIGSRSGALLFATALLSPLKRSIGVEVNKQFADLSSSLALKYGMSEKVTIINDDIINCTRCFQEAHVIIMNNVFEFFADTDKQIRLWRFCLKEIKRKHGALLITVPAINESLSALNVSLELSFLEKIAIDDLVASFCEEGSLTNKEDNSRELLSLHVYRVT